MFETCVDENLEFIAQETYQTVKRVVNINKISKESDNPPDKILICGPSNAAVDEIIRKVLKEGLYD